jgi:hypothetical protein
VSQDGIVGTETCYGLDSPGIERRCGRDLPHPSRPALRPTRSHGRVQVLLPGGKAAKHSIGYTPLSSAKKEHNYTSSPIIGLHGLFLGELWLIILYVINTQGLQITNYTVKKKCWMHTICRICRYYKTACVVITESYAFKYMCIQ